MPFVFSMVGSSLLETKSWLLFCFVTCFVTCWRLLGGLFTCSTATLSECLNHQQGCFLVSTGCRIAAAIPGAFEESLAMGLCAGQCEVGVCLLETESPRLCTLTLEEKGPC